jgi:D-glycero-D-manno-heptose 1,7-bisphosphate phosphatase
VFLDRDGTLIEQVHHLTEPGDVRLIPRAAQALRTLKRRGYCCVLITNQSVIGRGKLTLEGLSIVHAELERQLAGEGVVLDGIYFCPVKPEQKDPTVVEHPDRKPGPGMLLRAAAELDLDVTQSWMIGDAVSDLLAGRNAGCRGSILVRTGYGRDVSVDHSALDYTVDDLWAAAELIERLDAPHGGAVAEQGENL